nr:helix-turn-helix transcriptional regulator [uncultured Duganella sp.]
MDATNKAIKAIYEAAAEPDQWSAALEAICAAVDGWGAQMIGMAKADGRIAFSYHARLPADGVLEYLRHYHSIDPRTPLALAMDAGQWMHDHEHLDDAFVADDPFYQNFLIPNGSRYVSEVKLVDDVDGVIVLGMMSGGGCGPFDAAGRETLRVLGAHMAAALRLRARHLFNRPADLVGRTLVHSLPYPLLLLRPDGAIAYASPVAEQLMAAPGGAFGRREGRLVCHGAGVQAALAARLCQMTTAEAGVGAPGWMPVAAAGRASAWLLLVRPEALLGAFGMSLQVLVLLGDARAREAPDAFTLSVAFGLTPAESRVAEGLLRGLSPAEIAAQCHVELSTVRTQLRALMAKTGTQKQGELMLCLGALPHVLAARGG